MAVSFDANLRRLEDKGSCAVSGILNHLSPFFPRYSSVDRRENFNFQCRDERLLELPGLHHSMNLVSLHFVNSLDIHCHRNDGRKHSPTDVAWKSVES